MSLSGRNPERDLVEIVELPEHPFFIGVQFHPEFKSAPLRPHPIFDGFVAAALAHHRNGSASGIDRKVKQS
jgi:CTP synthase